MATASVLCPAHELHASQRPADLLKPLITPGDCYYNRYAAKLRPVASVADATKRSIAASRRRRRRRRRQAFRRRRPALRHRRRRHRRRDGGPPPPLRYPQQAPTTPCCVTEAPAAGGGYGSLLAPDALHGYFTATPRELLPLEHVFCCHPLNPSEDRRR